jgi:hypothetical protein
MRQISVAILFVSVLLSPTSLVAASADFSGTWRGSISGIENCPNGRGFLSLAAIATFVQSGDSVSGNITLAGNDPCMPSAPAENDALPISGTASGSTLVSTFKAANGETIRAAIEVNGNLMTLTITGTSARGSAFGPFSGTLTRITNQATEITRFVTIPSTISAGDSATLIWAVTNATSVVIDNGIGPVRPFGSITISPTETTTYTITATGTSTVSAKTTVTVAGAGPRVAVGERPQGMLQIAGNAGGTDSFTVTNLGSAATAVTLSQSGDFFQLDRTSFTLQPRAAQPVAITALAQPAGIYTGTVTIASGNQTLTVLVRLLVAARPALPVDPRPAAARFETSAPAGQNPPAVSARFTNRGRSTVQALIVTDVPWIIPANTMITIQPGQSQDLSFTIDRTKRDDGGAIGSAAGNLTLRFLGPANGIGAFGATSTSTSASTQVIDVVKATASTGVAPPLQSGEVAFYLPGCGTLGTTVCDAFFSSRATSAITDLRLHLPTNQQVASIATLNANLSVGLLSLTRTVFGFEGSTSLQGRSAEVANLSVSALRIVNPEAGLAYATSVPVLRSDRGVAAGSRLVLSGVQRSDAYTTSIIVQELSGSAATAELQAYNASGAPIGSASTISIPAFGETNDAGATTVAGASSVVIRNTSSGTGRINAVGRVESAATRDTWTLLEPSITAGSASQTLIMPMPSPAGTGQTTLFVTNVTAAPVEVRTETVGGASRRRAVGFGDTSSANLIFTTVLGPLQTISPAVTSTAGYVRLGAPEGSVSASARLTLLGASGEAFGGALPLVPDSAALRPTETKRFAGVDDASAASISAKVPSTYRTSLIMIETGGASTSVQVTLRFVLSGTLASSRATISRVFTVGAGQAFTISDLASAVIGLSRDTLGNLRNMQLDVQVLDGGRVLPFVQSIDNATGDVTMRSE